MELIIEHSKFNYGCNWLKMIEIDSEEWINILVIVIL
jgi:hypothetical protein